MAIPFNKAKHFICDIETLGTNPGSVVTSIGGCILDMNLSDPVNNDTLFNCNINIIESLAAGFTVDKDTAEWWMDQDEKAYKSELSLKRDYTLKDCINSFYKYLMYHKVDYFWGNSPDFDFGLLKSYFDYCDIPTPWKFYNTPDVRTIKGLGLYNEEGAIVDKGLTHHKAVDDAVIESHILYNTFTTVYK